MMLALKVTNSVVILVNFYGYLLWSCYNVVNCGGFLTLKQKGNMVDVTPLSPPQKSRVKT